MAATMAITSSCHPQTDVALSKITSHFTYPPGSQHDVGATRIGRRKAPEQFPFRSSCHAASLDDDSVWGIVLQRHPVPPSEAITFEAAWADAASSAAINFSPSSSLAAEFSSSFSPEAITKECHRSITPPSHFRHSGCPPDPVPNPLSPEDHACIPVSWKGESRGKGVGVGDGSVCLLERSRSRNRGLEDPVAETCTVLPIMTIKVQDQSSHADTEGAIESTKSKREFPGREFCGDGDEELGLNVGTDKVFWKKSTTRKPAPAAAWDWDRMSRQLFRAEEMLVTRTASNKTGVEQGGNFALPENVCTGHRIIPLEAHTAELRYQESKRVARDLALNETSSTGQRHERAVRRLKGVIGHITGIVTLSDLDQEESMKRAWGASRENR